MAKVKLKKKLSSAAFSGSLIQQGFGESLDKGYCMWVLNGQDVSHTRRLISNDHGWYKMTISRGENIEERIDNIKFSNNKRKTKIHIIYEDFEENYSIERLNQIKQLVKDKYGCEVIHVEFQDIEKEKLSDSGDESEEMDPENFTQMLDLFLSDNEFDIEDDDELEKFNRFCEDLEREIGIQPNQRGSKRFALLTTKISNVFSFGVEPTFIDWSKLKGITGIFGGNYCGKSNLLKAVVWGMFQHIMGGANHRYLINVYTSSNLGYVENTYDIDNMLFRTLREVKKRKLNNTYQTKFEVFREVKNDDGTYTEKWTNTLSDNTTADNTEVKNMIQEALGTYEDFTKVSIHAQNEKDGYLSLEQQEKNDLIARYLNLQSYRTRFDYVKKPYNELRLQQKQLGNAADIEIGLKDLGIKLVDNDAIYKGLNEEKTLLQQRQDDDQNSVLEYTKKLHKIEESKFLSKEDLVSAIDKKSNSLKSLKIEHAELEAWLSENPTKELDIDPSRTDAVLERELLDIRAQFTNEKERYLTNKKWIDNNKRIEVTPFDASSESEKYNILNGSLAIKNSERTVFLGKKCPTCHHPTKKANPDEVARVDAEIIDIKNNMESIVEANSLYTKQIDHNKEVDKKEALLLMLEISLKAKNESIATLKKELENFHKSKDFILANSIIVEKKSKLKSKGLEISQQSPELERLITEEQKYDDILLLKKENVVIDSKIEYLKEQMKLRRVKMHEVQNKINDLLTDIRLLHNSINDQSKKLNDIRSGDRKYKFYSIYLQAVDRSGIPAMVIKKKLLLINNKVNSILQSMVDFKMEFSIDMKGNISELFYNTETKWDSLPLSSGSGAQQFIVSIAIKDALNHISKRSIIQPSIIMIDEGFGVLDDNLRGNVLRMLEYLKNKYQNVLIITHLDEVKEGADHVIEATRDRSVISEELREKDAKSGITQLIIKR